MPCCSVSGCTKEKRNKIDPDHKFYSFPKTSPLIDKWIKFCRKDSLTKEQCLKKGATVCSIHFTEDSIEIPLKYRLLPQFAPKNMRILKKDAVPKLRHPKKKKGGEDDDPALKERQKMEYRRIVAELLEQSEKEAAAEKERQEETAAKPTSTGDVVSEKAGSSKTPTKSKKQSKEISGRTKKPVHKKQTESVLSKGDDVTKKCHKKDKIARSDAESHMDDDDVEIIEPVFQTEDIGTADSLTVDGSSRLAEDAAAELVRLKRENKKLTDLTIKQSLQIADLIKQRNDLWREKDPKHKYFHFPKSPDICRKWVKACGRKDEINFKGSARICSIHFAEDSIDIPLKYRLLPQYTPRSLRTLKKDALPTLHLPKSKNIEKMIELKERQQKLEYQRIVAELLEQSEREAAEERVEGNAVAVEQKEEANGGQKKSAKSTPGKGKASKKKLDLSPKKGSSPLKKGNKGKKGSSDIETRGHDIPITVHGFEQTGERNSQTQAQSTVGKTLTFTECANGSIAVPESEKRATEPGKQQESEDYYLVEVYGSNFQTEDVVSNEVSTSNQQLEEMSAELLRCKKEIKRLTDLTLKQSLQITDLIKQRNDLWREKGDLWFRKRVDHQRDNVQMDNANVSHTDSAVNCFNAYLTSGEQR